ncbi:MAG: hypothetical protein QGG74_05940 [Phycisphaerales bacterium]|nr:hypothetical protein [Phycisphaerales bacterium]
MLRSLIASACLLLTTMAAIAQGMGRQFAEPISWPTLRDQLVLIAPSDAQLDRIASEHDAYLADFTTLRDGDIAAFLNDTKGMGGMMLGAPDEGRRAVAKVAGIRRKIADLDDAMFARIAAILGETQQAGLDRVKGRRQRDRLRARRSLGTMGGSVSKIEPRDAIDWASLSDADRPAIEATLHDWEDGYTSRLKSWATANDLALVDFIAAIGELMAQQSSFSEESPPEPEEMAELVNSFQRAQKKVQASVRPQVNQLQNHISGGLKSLAEMLPAEQRFVAIRTMIPTSGLQNRVSKVIRGARRAGVDEATMGEIERIEAEWEIDAVPMMIESMSAGWKDDAARDEMVMEATADGSMAFDLPTREHSQTLRTRWNARHAAAIDDIAALVPEVDKKSLVAMGQGKEREESHSVESSTTVIIGSSGDEEEGAVVVSSSVSSGRDPFSGLDRGLTTIPSIQQFVLDGLARDLRLDDAGRSSLEALHADHESARMTMETERGAERRAMRKEMSEAFARGETPDQATQMKLGLLMMQPISREGLDDLDAAFFAGVAELTDDPDLVEPWRLSRIRELSVLAGGMMSASAELIGVPDNRWKVDLFTMIERSDMNEPDRLAASAVLEDWHATATTLSEELKQDRDALDAGMHAMMKTAESGGKVEIDLTAAMEIEKLQQEASKKRNALSQLTQRTADAIAEAVADSNHFHLIWVDQAFPSIAGTDAFSERYRDAAKSDGLTDEQRGAIAMLAAEHNEAWWLETEAAIAIVAAEREQTRDQGQAFYEAQQIKQEIDRHIFARREAGLKRLEQLRTILTDQQLAAAAGLADPAPPQTLALPF